MFGKIRYIDDITAVVDINKDNMVVPNLMNLHVVFENDIDKLLGEVKKVDTETVHIDLLGQFVENRFIAGTIKKPTLDSKVRVINDDELNIILGKDDEKSLYLGHSAIYPEKNVYIDINQFFSNHAAIFGNTGSGKSCSVARIVQNIFLNKQFLSYNANLFIFDAYGEYKNAFKVLNQINPNYQYKFITSNPIDPDDVQLNIPVFLLTIDDICLLLQADNHHQYTIVERMLKLAKLFSKDDEETKKLKNHLIAKAIMSVLFSNQNAAGKKNDIFTIINDCSTPEFNVNTDIQGIGYTRKFSECFGIDRNGEFGESVLINEYLLKFIDDELESKIDVPTDAFYTLDDLERALSFTLIGDGFLGNRIMQDNAVIMQVRLHSLNNSSNRKFFSFKEYITIDNYISSLIIHNNRRSQIININLEDVDDNLAKTIVKIFSKMIFDFAKKRRVRAAIPFHLFIEEAHRYVVNDNDHFLLGYNIFERIAKEGRKYGVMLDLVSQRPVEISETVIAQTSNFCILKMTHPRDLDYINKMLPNISGDIIEKLTSLQSGTMVAFGSAFKIPVIVKMDMPNPAPYSSNCDVLFRWKPVQKQ
ncbi:ATP-binding protein [bacterium]|nr:ATP-binding protein [bacterium]MBD9115014.1 ATP-binding protein [bacterium]